MRDRRTALAVLVEVFGVLLAIVGAFGWAVPLGLIATGMALTYYVAPLLEVRE